jgi:hypothetical protein
MLDLTTKFWKHETEKEAKSLAERELLIKVERLMDKFSRGITTADYVMMTEARNDLINLINNKKLEGGITQALAERERILGILDDYNLGGQLNGIIEKINEV